MDLQTIIDKVVTLETLIPAILRISGIIVLAAICSMVFSRIMLRIEKRIEKQGLEAGDPAGESSRRAKTLVDLGRQIVMVVIWVVAAVMALQETGVEIGPILAGAGIAGVALGFGAQTLVADLIAGFFIILENQVRVGDAVKVNGVWGMIEQISFRTLVLRDFSGEVHIYPNGSIQTLSNQSNGWSAHVFHMGVAYKEDVDSVMDVMRAVMKEMKEHEHWGTLMLNEGQIQGLDSFDDSAVTIRGRIKTHPLQQYDVGREFNRRIKIAFDERGIEIPFPHRTLYFGEASPPIQFSRRDTVQDSA